MHMYYARPEYIEVTFELKVKYYARLECVDHKHQCFQVLHNTLPFKVLVNFNYFQLSEAHIFSLI